MNRDKITDLCGAVIQHGPLSDRIYMMSLGAADPLAVINGLHLLAEQNNYSKLFAKVPADIATHFLDSGFMEEARVPGMYKNSQDVLFMGKFLHPDRGRMADREKINHVLHVCETKKDLGHGKSSSKFSLRILREANCREMAEIYRRVFKSYPFPITDPEYLLETMRSHVVYAGVFREEKLIALASAEIDTAEGHAELTDFATLSDHQGSRLSGHLLEFLLGHLQEHPELNIQTGYTIARAVSYGMNITFARSGFSFGGTLINNTNISGSMESMNVWYKKLL